MLFISHDFDDRSDFENITDALKAEDISYFDPRDLLPGSSLREKLHEAIRTCSGCIFIATRNSIKSSWCQAELGAFWGAGKRVCTFISDKTIKDNDIPPQIKGDLWTSRISSVVAAVKDIEAHIPQNRMASTVAELEVPELLQLIRQEFLRVIPQPRELLKTIQKLLQDKALSKPEEELKSKLRESLEGLIGLDYGMVDAVAQDVWAHTGSAEATFGRWTIYANGNESGPGRDVYTDGCLLLTARDGRVVAAGAAWWVGGFYDSQTISEFSVFVGGVRLYSIQSVC